MREFVCVLCQRDYGTAERFYEHLSTHTREEVELLKKLAEKEFTMTEEEWKAMNWELVRGFMEAEERVKEEAKKDGKGT